MPLGSADREIAPRLAWTGHAGEVWAACLTPGAEDPQATAPKVFTAGVAKTAAVCRALHGWQAVPGHRAEKWLVTFRHHILNMLNGFL